uniref:Uncharacterized protein n=1 Tax=Knipowitschia caucasica TaxID=637954 RepID=A0AAV2MSJ2_KNICA
MNVDMETSNSDLTCPSAPSRRVSVGVSTKVDAFGPVPPLSHQIDFLQCWNERRASSGPGHMIWDCQGLYIKQDQLVLVPQASGYLDSHSSDTSPSQEEDHLSFVAALAQRCSFSLCIVSK